MKFDGIQKSLSRTGSSLASLIKVALLSKRSGRYPQSDERDIIIMGNGPSLRKALDEDLDILRSHTTMAVNFAANTPELFKVRPSYYVMADGHFFNARETDPNVAKLWENLLKVDWPMTLFVPATHLAAVRTLLKDNANVSLLTFNLTPAEGNDSLCHRLYDKHLAMPRPRNVMIPAIMLAIWAGFRRVALIGADHTWSKSLWVDDCNRVISVQPHFYADNEKERTRVENEYAGYHLHDILQSLTIAFRSYFDISRYAKAKGVEIVNATPGSFIDAFPRTTLREMYPTAK